MGTKKKSVDRVCLPDITYVTDVMAENAVISFSQQIGWQISKFNIPDVWLDTQGEGITVAVLDTGVNTQHPDLAHSIKIVWNAINNSEKNGDDRDGHGTHCTGIITANNNDIGMVGVAPESMIVGVKVLGDDGSGTMATVAAGIRTAIQHKVDIISMSLGGPVGSSDVHAAIKEAYNNNIPVICAAGNSGDTGELSYPARYPETISIGALTSQNIRAEYSQTGARLDFMAPGSSIFSTYAGGNYRVLSGTSMATPWVSGVVALMMSKHRKVGGKTPLHSVEDVREHLRKTCIDLDEAGKDPRTGYGLIDVTIALETLEPEPLPETDPTPDPVPEPTPEPTPDPEPDDRIQDIEIAINDLENQVKVLNEAVAVIERKLSQLKSVL